MIYPALFSSLLGDWQTNKSDIPLPGLTKQKRNLCCREITGETGAVETRGGLCQHVQEGKIRPETTRRGVRSIPGRPGNEPHSTRPDQAHKHPCTTISTFGRLSAANKHTSDLIHPYIHTDGQGHIPLLHIPATRYIPPWHSVLTIRRPQTRRSQETVLLAVLSVGGFAVCLSICLSSQHTLSTN